MKSECIFGKYQLLIRCENTRLISSNTNRQRITGFNDIREVVVSPAYRAMRELHPYVKDIGLVPFSYYDAVEGAREISKDILGLAGRVIRALQESLKF
jgi:hypothetical protein